MKAMTLDAAIQLIQKLQVTEKGALLSEKQNKYLFRVSPSANKIQIKKAVEAFFRVKVVKVNTMNYAGKKRRVRSFKYGRRAHWKRAVVTLASGQKIETA